MPRRADIDINVRANARAVGELRKEFQSNERSAVKGFERIGQAGSRAFRDVERARERAFGGRRALTGGFAQTLRQLKDVTRTTNEFATSIKVIPKEFESAVRRSRRELSKLEESYKRAFGTTGRIGGRRADAPTVSNALTGGFRETLRQLREQQKQLEVARVATNRYSDSFISLRKQVRQTTETVRSFVSRGLRGLRGFGADSLRRLGEQFRRFGSSVRRAVDTARRGFSNFRRAVEQGARRINRTVDRIRDRFKTLSASFSANPITRLFRGIGGAVTGVFRLIGRTISRVISAIRSTVGTIAGLVTGLGLTRAFKAVVDAGQRAELSIIQLGTLFRTTREEAKDLFFAVRQFARPLPVTTDEVVSAFIRLRSVGVEPTSESIKGLINASLALGRPLSNIVLAVQSLETESLRKLGINLNRRGEQAILNFGSETIILPKDDREIREALIELFNRAFAGALESSLQNFRVNLAVLQSVVGDTTSDLGLRFLPALTTILQRTTAWLQVNRDLVDTSLGDFFGNIGDKLKEIVSVRRIDSVFRTFFDLIDRIAGTPAAVSALVDRVEDGVRSFYNWLDPIKQLTTAFRLLGKGIGFIGNTIQFVTGLFSDFANFVEFVVPGGETGLDPTSNQERELQERRRELQRQATSIGGQLFINQTASVRNSLQQQLQETKDAINEVDELIDRRRRITQATDVLGLSSFSLEELRRFSNIQEPITVGTGFTAQTLQPEDIVAAVAEQIAKQERDAARDRRVEEFDPSDITAAAREIDRVRQGFVGVTETMAQLVRNINSTTLAFVTLEGQQKLNEKAALDLSSVTAKPLVDLFDLAESELTTLGQISDRASRPGARRALDNIVRSVSELIEVSRGALSLDNLGLTGKALELFEDFQGAQTPEERAERITGFRRGSERIFFQNLAERIIPRISAETTLEGAQQQINQQFDLRGQAPAAVESFNIVRAQIVENVLGGREPTEDEESFITGLFAQAFGGALRTALEELTISPEQRGLLDEQRKVAQAQQRVLKSFDRAITRGFRNLFGGNFNKAFSGFFTDLRKGIQDELANSFSLALTGDNSPFTQLAKDSGRIIRGGVRGIGIGLNKVFDSTIGSFGAREVQIQGLSGEPEPAVEPGPLAGRGREFAAATLTAISAGQQGPLQGAIGGGLAGGSLGAQLGAAGSLGGPAGAAIGAALGIGVGLVSSLFGSGSRQSRITLRQTEDLRVADIRRNQLSDAVTVSTQRFDVSPDTLERTFLTGVADVFDRWTDLMINMPPELFQRFQDSIDSIDFSAGTFDLTTDNTDAQVVAKRFQDYVLGIIATIAPDVRQALIDNLVDSGVDPFIAERRVDDRIARIDAATETEQRVQEAEGFFDDIETFGTAREILEGTASGIGDMVARATNLQEVLNLTDLSLGSLEGGLENLIKTGTLDAKTLERWTMLRDILLELPRTFQQQISSAVGNITAFSEFLPDNPERNEALTNTLFDTLEANRAIDISSSPEQRLAFLEQERGILTDIINLERQKFESEIEAAQKTKEIYDSVKVLGDNIQSTLLSLRTGTDSPLSPAQRVAAVQGTIAGIQQQLVGTEGIERVRLLERLVPLFNQIPGLGSLFGAGSPEARALFAQGEAGLTDLLDDKEFQSQNERLASIGDKLDREFTLSERAQERIKEFEEKNLIVLGEIRDKQDNVVEATERRGPEPSDVSVIPAPTRPFHHTAPVAQRTYVLFGRTYTETELRASGINPDSLPFVAGQPRVA